MTYPKYSAHRDMQHVYMEQGLGLVAYLDQHGNCYRKLDRSFQKIKPNYPVPAIPIDIIWTYYKGSRDGYVKAYHSLTMYIEPISNTYNPDGLCCVYRTSRDWESGD